ncbi:ATP-grasp domain-containing protein [Neobacillus cucumis]|uniref:ATP-grasp domain-containing protein n=1 Tax=Neobacillus cucumis TaxID=1740721 RepID=UPI0028536321|nr:ATP-grasp domain-containing protein [Neobacillus cucumis]MDR4947834.1 ATP-grasp domain-containing protein [Neobacillus cucumis]
MNKLNVLITGSGSVYGVAVIQSLIKSKLNVKLIATDAQPYALGLYLAHHSHLVPPVQDEQLYLKRLLEILRLESIDAIFIASSQELSFFSRNKALIENEIKCKVFANPYDVLSICIDKWNTVHFLNEHHFPCPKTIRYPEDIDKIDSFIEDVGFPFIAKPRHGNGSEDIHLVKDFIYFKQVISDKKDMILQQFLPDEQNEFTVGVCCGTNGKVLSSIALKRQLQDGITMSAISDDYKEITDYCENVAKVLKPYGPCNFQLRMWNGKPYIFEINPRFSSSTGMRTLLGVNEPEILLKAEVLQESIPERQILKASVIRQYTDYLIPTEEIEILKNKRFIIKDSNE